MRPQAITTENSLKSVECNRKEKIVMSMWKIEGENGKYSILGLMLYYVREIDKQEYPDFECWKADMLRAGLIKLV